MEPTERIKQITELLKSDNEISDMLTLQTGKAIRFRKKTAAFILYAGDLLMSIATILEAGTLTDKQIHSLNSKMMFMSVSYDENHAIEVRYNFLMPNFDSVLFQTIIKFATDEVIEFLLNSSEEIKQ